MFEFMRRNQTNLFSPERRYTFVPDNIPSKFKVGDIVKYEYLTQMKALYGNDSDLHIFDVKIAERLWYDGEFFYKVVIANPDDPASIAPNGKCWVFYLNNPCSEGFLLRYNPDRS